MASSLPPDFDFGRRNLGDVFRIELTFTKDGSAWNLSTGGSGAVLKLEKPDKSTILSRTMTAKTTGADGVFYYVTTATDLDTIGWWTATAVVTDTSTSPSTVDTYAGSIAFHVAARPTP
jgi:hypothetical protein